MPAFQPPEARNAARTLVAMACLLGGAVRRASRSSPDYATSEGPIHTRRPRESRRPDTEQTVIAQVARTIYGDSIGFYLFQTFTALILFLAANTSFAAFPRLAAILAEDGFLPRQFAFRGDRLAFSLGIVMLGVIAAIARVPGRRTHARAHPALRGRRLHRLHHQPDRHGPALAAERAPGWRGAWRSTRSAAVLTGRRGGRRDERQVVDGASLVVLLIPILVGSMLFIHRQYDAQTTRARTSARTRSFRPPHREERVVVPVPGINRAVSRR